MTKPTRTLDEWVEDFKELAALCRNAEGYLPEDQLYTEMLIADRKRLLDEVERLKPLADEALSARAWWAEKIKLGVIFPEKPGYSREEK